MVRLGSQRALVPGLCFVDTPKLAIGEANKCCNVGMIIEFQRPHRGDPGVILTVKDEVAGLYKGRARAVFQQMGGKSMAQRMGRDVIESRFGRVLID